MTGANDEETANHSDGDGKTEVTDTSSLASPSEGSPSAPPSEDGAEPTRQSEEVESGVVELIEATPTPVVAPVVASVSMEESTRRPPPLPRARRRTDNLPVGVARPQQPSPPGPAVPGASGKPGRVPIATRLPSVGAHSVPLPSISAPGARSIEPEAFLPEVAVTDARKRLDASAADRLALARARTELGIVLEVATGDTAAALAEYRAAHSISASMTAPLAGARRLTPLHPSAPALALLEAEVRLTNDPSTRAARALELGMLLRASGSATERTWQAYREALAIHPGHAGALRGLESALSGGSRTSESTTQMEALAVHREVMATVFRSDARLSAWIEVERGQLLERLGRMDAARAAFDAALALDGGIGPVRDAYARHLLTQGCIEELVKAWATEATLETDGARAARLLYAAGRLASERLDQKQLAVELFERAVSSDAAAASIRRAALRELFRLYDSLGQSESTVATGNRLLAFARDNEMAYWHRRLVPPCEALGHHAEVALHAANVLAVEPWDAPMRAILDRALSALGQHEQRVAMFTDQAARATAPAERIQLLLRAAQVAEHDMGRTDLALAALRSAFASDAGNADVTDALVRLLTPGTPPSPTDPDDPSGVRTRIDFYVEAAATAADPARKVAHLEKLALIWEDEVRAPERALAVFAHILTVEPHRRSAILGLARCAGRAGNDRELVRALVMEADVAGGDPALERSLLLRAAHVASQRLGDNETALDLIKRVLNHSNGDAAALRAAFEILDRAGRGAEALAHLRLLLAQKNKPQTPYSLQSEIARYLEERLHRPGEALTAWREAHRLDQDNPTPRAELRRILLANGDFRAVAEEMAALAVATTDPAERAELLVEAAEIYDDRLGDAERAIPLLTEARTAVPHDMMVVDRLDRAFVRTGKRTERLALLLAVDTSDPRGQFALAALQAEERDPTRALKPLAELSAHPSTCVPALRVLEHAVRRTERWKDLNAVLRKQVESFSTVDAKLGAVVELVALEEYDDAGTPEGLRPAREILAELAPDDLLSHELYLRHAGLFREGTPHAAVVPSLDRLATSAPDAMATAALRLAAGLVLEQQHGTEAQKEALVAFASALAGWPDNLTAARGARRLAVRLGESATFIEASTALGAIELDPSTRAARLLDAADAVARQEDGDRRAFDLTCRALAEDANDRAAADAVIAAVDRGHDAGRATEALRAALEHTMNPDQAARLGVALAHLALRNLGDQTVALEALRRARKRAPKHAGTLLALAEVSAGMGLQSDAVEAATAALGSAREPEDRLRATITLAEVHARMSAFRDIARREAQDAEKWARQADARADVVARLAAVYQALGDDVSAERVLVQAILLDGQDQSALDRLSASFGTGRDAGERVASAIRKAMSMAESSGKPPRPEWLATLGKVQAIELDQRQEGLAHVYEAIRLAPGRVESYQALVDVYGGAYDAATRALAGQLGELGRSATERAQVIGVLSLLARTSEKAERHATTAAAKTLLAFFHDESVGTASEVLATGAPAAESLDQRVLRPSLVGKERANLLELASVLAEPIGKALRHEPESFGVLSRDRLTSRASHPLRALSDRMARAFGDLHFDVYVDATGTDTPRLLATETPALVLPKTFAALPEVDQAAALARLLTFVALEVPWIDSVSGEDTDGLLFGGVRTVDESWGQGQLSPSAEKAASAWRSRLAKVVSRKVRRGLEDQLTQLRPQTDTSDFRQAVRAAALKAAYVTTGGLGATLRDAVRADVRLRQSSKEELPGNVLADPTVRQLVAFALSDAASDLRRSVGTLAS